jgi:hypothetical protein
MISIEDLLSGEQQVSGNIPEQQVKESSHPEIIKFQVGDVITGRFLPNRTDPQNSWIEYTQSGIQSQSTGEYVDCGLLRKSKNLKCPLVDIRQKLWNKFQETGNESFKEARDFIRLSPKAVFNFFVILHKNDKVEDFTEVKLANRVLRLPANKNWKTKEVTSLVYSQFLTAYNGSADNEKLGNLILNLGPTGISYKIKISSKGEFINYDPAGCGFESMQKAIPGLADWKAPYDSVYDLTKYVPEVKSEDEVNDIINNHLTDIVNSLSTNRTIFSSLTSKSSKVEDDDDIPMGDENSSTAKGVDNGSNEEVDDIIKNFKDRKKNAKASN